MQQVINYNFYVWGASVFRVTSLENTLRSPNFLPLSNFVSWSIFSFNKSAAACKRQLEFKKTKTTGILKAFFSRVFCIPFFCHNCSTDNNNDVIS